MRCATWKQMESLMRDNIEQRLTYFPQSLPTYRVLFADRSTAIYSTTTFKERKKKWRNNETDALLFPCLWCSCWCCWLILSSLSSKQYRNDEFISLPLPAMLPASINHENINREILPSNDFWLTMMSEHWSKTRLQIVVLMLLSFYQISLFWWLWN